VGHGAASRRGSADVTALLDAEQFQALSVSPDRPLLVLGSAGSGKTTVALHRLSKLAFDDRQRFPQSRMKVVVPEEGLARLARRLLAPLGMEKLPVETLAAWSRRAAIFELEIRGLKLSHETPPLVARLKRHPALREPLLARLGPLNTLPVGFHQLRRRLANEFTDRAFLTEVVMAARQDLPVTAVEETVRHTMLQLANPLSRELEGWDAQRIQAVDGQPLEEGTPDELAGTLDVEDLPLLLFLKAKRTGGLRASSLAHLVLDESEDFSVFELYVLGKLLRQVKSCTIAGDEMQQTLSSFAGWGELLDTLGVGKPAVCRLQVSYRCPRPVTELARKVLGPLASPASGQLGRDGVGVGIHHFPDAAQAQLFLSNALRDLVDREPRASVGVIASGSEQARALHRLLKEVVGARLVLEGEFSFDPGVDVTDVDNVKGLEFDYVIIPDATAKAYPATDDARRRLHVAITRTSHQLWVLSSGVQSPLLRG
jgi:DNA helicase IV